jgi:flagellar hook-associated protein 2
MVTALEPYTLADGILTARTDGINDSIKNLDTRILEMEYRVERFEDKLVRQFAALEQSMSGIQQQGQYLAGALR